MNFRKWVIASVALLAGCHAAIYGTATDFARFSLGMNKDHVVATLGKPVSVSVDADKGEEVFVYKRMKHAISE